MTQKQGWIIIGLLVVAIVGGFIAWKLNQPPEHKWTDDLILK